MNGDSFKDLASSEMSSLDQASREFITQMNLLLKLASMHDATNEALQKPIEALISTIGRILDLDPDWKLKVVEEHLFANQNRIRLDNQIYVQYTSLVDQLKQRRIGVVSFERTPTSREVIGFIYSLQQYQAREEFASLTAKLASEGVDWVRLEPELEVRISSPDLLKGRQRRVARQTFFGAVYMTGGMFQAVEQRKAVNVKRVRRAVQSFLDLLDLDEDYVMGMTSIKNYDEYTYNHSVNITIMALNMGRSLGLSRSQLSELGMSGIFHDMGKVSLPRELVNKEAKLDDLEWRRMYRHPIEGVKKLVRLKGITDVTVKLIISVYEHHVNYDFTGYPSLPTSAEASLFSRILRIVDSYDAMTTRRVYTKNRKHPVVALEEIRSLAGTYFDPDLAKVFINMIGIYPIGTMVQLDGGESGLVVAQRRNTPRGTLPVVRVLVGPDGRNTEEREVDLSAEPHRSITGYYDLGECHADPAWYLLASGDETIT